MQTHMTNDQLMPSTATPELNHRQRHLASLQKWRGPFVWLVVGALFVFFSMPMLKAAYYQASNTPVPKDNIAWLTDYRAALAESKKSGKPVLLDFSASWCPPCQVMKHEVWPDAEVGAAVAKSFIPVYMDADSTTSAEAAQRYGVSSIPSIIIVDGDGNVLRSGGYMSKASMLEFLNKPLKAA